MDTILVYTVCSNEEEAKKLASSLIEEGLAACVNILPGLSSCYKWEGKICYENEYLLLIKALESEYKMLETRIKALHSYSIPCILKLPLLGGNAEYLGWLKSQIDANSPRKEE